MERIALWWIGEGMGQARVMEAARGTVERVFEVPTAIRVDPARPQDTRDARRGQHASTAILRWLVDARADGAAVLIGVTDVDLFIPVLTFVFGEAKLGGGVAVVSTARLAEAPTAPRDERVLTARLTKECIHELGHAFGLIHCVDPRCVMARSASLIHVDAKGATPCRDCRIRLSEFTRGGGGHGH